MNAIELFQKLMINNNLTAKLGKSKITYTEDGGLIIYPPSLIVEFINPDTKKVEESKE